MRQVSVHPVALPNFFFFFSLKPITFLFLLLKLMSCLPPLIVHLQDIGITITLSHQHPISTVELTTTSKK